jgi:hypothetical protein
MISLPRSGSLNKKTQPEPATLTQAKIPYHIENGINLLDPLLKDAAKLEPSELIYILREGLDYDHYIA